jgi:hypothetical protein
MIATLYETKQFKVVNGGLLIIWGYGFLTDDLALRAVIHVGVHLICCGSRFPGGGARNG